MSELRWGFVMGTQVEPCQSFSEDAAYHLQVVRSIDCEV